MRKWFALAIVLLFLLPTGCGETEWNYDAPAIEAYEAGKEVITMAAWLGADIYPSRRIVDHFNESQDEIFIFLVSYEDDMDTMTTDQSLARAHTSFLNHTPDLFEMVSFDAAKLRNAGLIADWYPIMRADESFDFNDYQTHIWKLLETDGALYQLCASFDLFGIGGSKELYGAQDRWTLPEFEAFLAEHSETLGTTRKRMLQIMLWYGTQFDYIDLESGTCQYETQAFYDWLAFLNRLPDTAGKELPQIEPVRLGNAEKFGMEWKREGYYTRAAGLPSQNAHGPAVAIDESFAISSETEHPEACWTFAKWLLSEETQEFLISNLSTAIPIRRSTWESQLERAALDGSVEGSLFYGNYMPPQRRWANSEYVSDYQPGLPQEEIEYLRRMVDEVDYVSMGFFDYEDITLIVEEEVLAYLAGDKSAEECARIIQSRVSVMLDERQRD